MLLKIPMLKIPIAFPVISFYIDPAQIIPPISYEEQSHEQIQSDRRFIHQREPD